METHLTRRTFIQSCLTASLALPLRTALSHARAQDGPVPDADREPAFQPERALPQRRLGRTGVMVSMLGLGGAWWMSQTQDVEQVEAIVHAAIDAGINYFDTAHNYGRSQENLGRIMGTPRRQGLFLASKVDARTYDGAMRQFETNLTQLRVAHIDLLQIHHINAGEHVAALGKPDGVLTALRKLREERAIRFIGVTGHPQYETVRECLEYYDDLDTFMCFINPEARTRPVFESQLPLARRKEMGIVAMKVYGGGNPATIIGEGDGQASARALLRFALSEAISVAIPAVSSLQHLRENIEIARTFKPMTPAERNELIGRFNPGDAVRAAA